MVAYGSDDARYGRELADRYFGKYAGVVADNGPPDSGTHRGEVLVTVPGILEETADGSGSQPLKVRAAPGLLPGFFFVPAQNDNVWVEFVNGDINFPIWTAVWYPQDATPKTADGDAPTQDQKIIRTKSGHVIEFDDTSGSEQIVISHGTQKAILTFDKDGITITSEKAIALNFKPSSGTGASLTIDENGVTATCGQSSLTLDSSQIALSRPDVTLKVASTVDVS